MEGLWENVSTVREDMVDIGLYFFYETLSIGCIT